VTLHSEDTNLKIYMKNICFCSFSSFLSCDKKVKLKMKSQPFLDLNVTRFDKIFFETQPEDRKKSQKEFLIFFLME
jgi:hypothetical protein